MIDSCACFDRQCANFIGIVQDDGIEETERVVCKAYPNGIPPDIQSGEDLHAKVRPDQDNTIIYEKGKI